MAGSVYAQSSSSGAGSVYAGGGTSGGKKAPHHHGGIVGLAEHLGADIKDSVLGIPTGVKQTIEHPGRTAKAIGHSYKETYGHGFHHFLHSFYQHPLGPILDAATIVTAPFGIGEGIAGSRVASVLPRSVVKASAKLHELHREAELRDLGELAKAGKLKEVEGGPGGHTKTYDRVGHLPRRFASHQLDRLMKQLPAEWPVVGELARYAKKTKMDISKNPQSLGLHAAEAQRAFKRLKSSGEKAAAHLHLTGTDPEKYAARLEKEEAKHGSVPERAAMIKFLRSPEVVQAFHSIEQNPRLQYAVQAGRNLSKALTDYRRSDAETELKDAVSKIDANAEARKGRFGPNATRKDFEQVEKWRDRQVEKAKAVRDASIRILDERPFLHMRLERGAEFAPGVDEPNLRHQAALIDELETKLDKALSNGDQDAVRSVTGTLQTARDSLARLETAAARKYFKGDVNKLREATNVHLGHRTMLDTPESSVEAIRAELEAQGRHEPVYVPDISPEDLQPNRKVTLGSGGGKGPQGVDQALRQDRAVLYLSGKLAMDPASIGVRFQQYARRALYDAVHQKLVENSVDVGHSLPKGWTYLRQGQSQRLPKFYNEIRGGEKLTIDDLITKHVGESTLAVPENLVTDLAGEFARSNRFVRRLYEKPTQIWRAIILNLRVGFLTNNVIGQHFLLMFHYFGPSLLKAWGSYLREVRPRAYETFKRGVLYHVFGKNTAPLAARDFKVLERQYAPQEVFGTNYRSQVPGANPLERGMGEKKGLGLSRATYEVERAGRGIGPISAKLSEDVPRELALRTSVVREMKRLGQKVPRQTEEFNRLAEDVMQNPRLGQRAIDEANRALGNYIDLSDFERSVLRQFVPFYGWLRAITKITFNAVVDTPGRMNLLLKLGAIGVVETQKQLGELPEWYRNLVPLGKNKTLSTKGLNPYASVADVFNALGGVMNSKHKGDLFTQLNPFVQSFIEAISGSNPLTGETEKSRFGPAGVLIGKNITDLPPVYLGKAVLGHGRESSRFGKTSGLESLAQFAGVPVRGRPHEPEKKKRKSSSTSSTGSVYAGY